MSETIQGSHYQLTTLPNGLRVITEEMPWVRSVAVGCWVDTGTRDELANEAGASHFLEHLLFKGSERYSARMIAETFDAIGAESNAFTSKDNTCFWARLLDADLATGLDLLAEMLQRPAFRQSEIDSERQVVIEEINMNDDDPSDVAFEEFTQVLFAGHPLEGPVLGTRASIRAMTAEDLSGYWERRYGRVRPSSRWRGRSSTGPRWIWSASTSANGRVRGSTTSKGSPHSKRGATGSAGHRTGPSGHRGYGSHPW